MSLTIKAGCYPYYPTLTLKVSQDICLDDGIWWVRGANGAGKSSTMRELLLPLAEASGARMLYAPQDMQSMIYAKIARTLRRDDDESLADVLKYFIAETEARFVEDSARVGAARTRAEQASSVYLFDEPPLEALLDFETGEGQLACIISHEVLPEAMQARLRGELWCLRLSEQEVELRAKLGSQEGGQA